MFLTFLGSCANQTETQEAVAFVVSECPPGGSVEHKLLVDTGPGIVAALLRRGISASAVNAVFITHTHGDHFAGFPYFAWQRFYEGLEGGAHPADLHVFGSAIVVKAAQTALELCYDPSSFPFAIHYHPVVSEKPFTVDGLSVLPVAVDHTAETCGLVVTNGKSRFAYSADTITSDRFIEQAAGVDLLVHEGMWTEDYRPLADRTKHSTAAEAGTAASRTGARQLVMVHIYPRFLGEEGRILAEASGRYAGPISVASAGMCIQIREAE